MARDVVVLGLRLMDMDVMSCNGEDFKRFGGLDGHGLVRVWWAGVDWNESCGFEGGWRGLVQSGTNK